jgi:hypothetical protein
VSRFERLRDLSGDLEGFDDGNWPTGGPLVQTLAVHEFEQEKLAAVRFVQPVYCGDVRMIQRRKHVRFAPEASHPFPVVGECVGQDLQRDVAFEPGVARAIYFAHPARTDGSVNLVGTKVSAGCQRHASRD